MFDTSKDVLYLVIAFCVLWFTIFLCWLLYYVVRILRQMNAMIKEWRERISRVDKFISAVKDKFENVGLFLEGAKKVVGFIKDREERKTKKGRRKRK